MTPGYCSSGDWSSLSLSLSHSPSLSLSLFCVSFACLASFAASPCTQSLAYSKCEREWRPPNIANMGALVSVFVSLSSWVTFTLVSKSQTAPTFGV